MYERMFNKVRFFLRCVQCLGELEFDNINNRLICKNDALHNFPIIDEIPSFVRRDEISVEDATWVFEYDEKAESYDKTLKKYDEWLGVDLKKETKNILESLPVKSSSQVLDTSTGTGRVIFAIMEIFPNVNCEFIGTDLSLGMLRVAKRKFTDAGVQVPLFHSHVTKLPFENESFDVITHFGGINTFSDIAATLEEWVRVLKPHGTLVISDEGLSPAAKKTERGVGIIKINKLFGVKPPLEQLPSQVKNIKLQWIARDTFYVIQCQKLSKEEL